MPRLCLSPSRPGCRYFPHPPSPRLQRGTPCLPMGEGQYLYGDSDRKVIENARVNLAYE